MAVVQFKKRARPRRSIRYYLCTDEGPFRVPLRLVRSLVAEEIVMPRFASSLQHFVEVLIEVDPKSGKKIKTRSTSALFDAEGKMDLHHATEALSVLMEGPQPKPVTEKVLDIEPTLRARRLERDAAWRAPPSALRLIRADIEGRKRLPTFMPG